MNNRLNIVSASNQAEMNVFKTIEDIRGLSDESLDQMALFANGINTVDDLPEELTEISRNVLMQKMEICMGIFHIIRELIDERKIEREK